MHNLVISAIPIPSAFFDGPAAIPAHARTFMEKVLTTLALAAAMFAGTNADDLVLLGIFYAQPGCRPRDVVLGQLAGIGCLTAIACLVAVLALSLPLGWVPLLGIVPICLGVRWLRRAARHEPPVVALKWWTIAGVTVANGADNLSVSIPVLTLQTGRERLLTAGVFFGLTLVWCWMARATVQNPIWGRGFSRVCVRAAPFVLIGIGLWTLAHHRIFGLDFVSYPLLGR